jgi:hypothetical protein
MQPLADRKRNRGGAGEFRRRVDLRRNYRILDE